MARVGTASVVRTPGDRLRATALPPDLGDWPISLRTVAIPGVAFGPTSSATPRSTTAGVLRLASPGTAEAPFMPAAGDLLLMLTALADPASTVLTPVLSRITPTSSETITPSNHRADPMHGAYVVSVDLPAGVGLRGVQVTYVPASSSVVLIEPRRVWDSRTVDGYLVTPGWRAGGKLVTGNSIDFNLDGVIPRYVDGVLANVTLDATEGSGFLLLWEGYGLIGPGEPQSPVRPPTSTINWFRSGQIVANLAVSRLGGGAGLSIASGGNGRTHVIVDILGYLA